MLPDPACIVRGTTIPDHATTKRAVAVVPATAVAGQVPQSPAAVDTA
jgi:hypothetical protein